MDKLRKIMVKARGFGNISCRRVGKVIPSYKSNVHHKLTIIQNRSHISDRFFKTAPILLIFSIL